MMKLFEWIGGIIAIACLIEIASNPKQVVHDIKNGPAPNLSKFNGQLHSPEHHRTKTLSTGRNNRN
jgi:hypothetical protein